MKIFKDKQELYYFCPKTLTYKKVTHPEWRNVKTLAIGALILLVIAFAVDHFTGNYLGNMIHNFVTSERKNILLTRNLYNLRTKVDSLEKALNHLADNDKNLRLRVNLPISSDDAKLSGTGGKSYDLYSEVPSDYLDTGINNLSKITEGLLRQVKKQKSSYEEILAKHDYNKEFFKAVPAIKPMDGPYDINGFGMRLHPILGEVRMHEGVDIHAPENTPVYASGDGTIKLVGWQGGYGLLVVIDHGYGYQSYYGHLRSSNVKVNETVKRGQLIANSGNTGLSAGPHLHYEVVYNNNKVDPVMYFVDDIDNIVNISLSK
jgi:murein DD-endopeptidase MepM/ murein hydrolase activator NlpD